MKGLKENRTKAAANKYSLLLFFEVRKPITEVLSRGGVNANWDWTWMLESHISSELKGGFLGHLKGWKFNQQWNCTVEYTQFQRFSALLKIPVRSKPMNYNESVYHDSLPLNKDAGLTPATDLALHRSGWPHLEYVLSVPQDCTCNPQRAESTFPSHDSSPSSHLRSSTALSTREICSKGWENRNLSNAKGSIDNSCRLQDPESPPRLWACTSYVQETRISKTRSYLKKARRHNHMNLYH